MSPTDIKRDMTFITMENFTTSRSPFDVEASLAKSLALVSCCRAEKKSVSYRYQNKYEMADMHLKSRLPGNISAGTVYFTATPIHKCLSRSLDNQILQSPLLCFLDFLSSFQQE